MVLYNFSLTWGSVFASISSKFGVPFLRGGTLAYVFPTSPLHGNKL
jgi:hypothetical protein